MHEIYQKTYILLIKKGPQIVVPEVVEIVFVFLIIAVEAVVSLIAPG